MSNPSGNGRHVSSAAKTSPHSRLLAIAALVVAAAALAGSLALSLALSLRACPLCFYQRTFAMSLVAVLGMGLLLDIGGGGRLSLLALPLATGGLGVAAFHVYLELSGALECPAGLFGLGTAPQQSLFIFAVLFALLAMDSAGADSSVAWGAFRIAQAGAVALGGLLVVASLVANPPMPEAKPYSGPPDICRPPYRAPSSH